MTDRERLLALLADFRIGPGAGANLPHEFRDGSHVVLLEGEGGVTGDDGLYCAFEFDSDGAFVSVEIGE